MVKIKDKIIGKELKKEIVKEERKLGGPRRKNGTLKIPSKINLQQASFTRSAPVAVSRVQRQKAPRIKMSGNGEICTVSHTEYVNEIAGQTNFTNTLFAVNPGISTLFIWLANIAQRFEQYRFKFLQFRLETENSTNQGGSVMCAVDYDALDAPPANKQALMSYKSAVRNAPWQRLVMPLDLAIDGQTTNFKYVRSGVVPTGADQRLYDLADFYVAVQNCNGASFELYVDYIVEFRTPQYGNPINSGLISSAAATTSGMTAAAPFGTGGVGFNQIFGGPGWTLQPDGTTLICNASGQYLLTLNCSNATAVTHFNVVPTGVNVIAQITGNDGGTSAETIMVVAAGAGNKLAVALAAFTVGGTAQVQMRCAPYSTAAV